MGTMRLVLVLVPASSLVGCGNVESDPAAVDTASSAGAAGSDATPQGFFVGSLGDGRSVFHDALPQRRRARPADLEAIGRLRATNPGPIAPARPLLVPAPSMTDRALAKAAKLPASAVIGISIELTEPGFDLGRLRGKSDDGRQALIAERREGLAPSQASLEARLGARGGRVLGRNWLVNVIDAEVPAGLVPQIATWPGVVAVSTPETFRDGATGWNGRQIRDGVLVQSLVNAGYTGNHHNRIDANGPVRIAFIETTLPLRNHVGWLDNPNGTNRIRKVYTCNPTCAITSAGANGPTHSTEVMWAAAGSIEQGQDSNFPGSTTIAQRDRSGVSSEAYLYYYQASASDAVRNAINQARADGADIINMSIGSNVCSGLDTTTFDASGINAALRSALDAGALPVVIAGNGAHATQACSLTYPAWRPDVVSVAALNTLSTNLQMNTTLLLPSSSRGGAELVVLGQSGRPHYSGIGLTAPGAISQYFFGEPASYSTVFDSGTSFAAPVVSGTAALLRDALADLGWLANDARLLMVNLLLLGDTWDEDTGGDLTTKISKVTGYGRLHAHYPNVANMNAPLNTGPWGWGTHRALMETGDIFTWTVADSGPEPSQVTQWKFAVTWTDASLGASSDIIVSALDACNGNQLVATDASFDFRKRVHLRTAQIAGKCLVMEVHALRTPSSGTVVYLADYFHSGNADALH